MTLRTLLARSLQFHARQHLGVLLGTIVGAAVLIGALLVGDSVRGSLRDMALSRLAGADLVVTAGDRLFLHSLGTRLQTAQQDLRVASFLRMPGAISAQDGGARANSVQVWGVDALPILAPGFESQMPRPGEVLLNEALARRLNAEVGDKIVLRVPKPTSLSRDAVITPRNDMTIALRLQVAAIVTDARGWHEPFANLDLNVSQTPPLNAFLRQEELATAAGVPGKASVLLVAGSDPRKSTEVAPVQSSLRRVFSLEDAEINVAILTNANIVQLSTPRIFLDDPILHAATNVPVNGCQVILTYLANLFSTGTNATPYSMITAAGPPYTPADLRDDEVVLNEWLAEDLQAKPGDSIQVTYYIADAGTQLLEGTNHFRVRGIVPIAGVHADRTLMPEFPGLAKAESTHDWDAGFPLVHKIRDKDEAYWKQHRGTPKAFVSLAAGQKLWANRFGSATAVRWPANGEQTRTNIYNSLLANTDPASVGFTALPVRKRALAAVSQGQDFGQLFLGLSFFLIIAALILIGMLFQFGLEQRAHEVGVLLATGFLPKQVRRLFLLEGIVIAVLGALGGMVGAVIYAQLMLRGLSTIWRDAVRTSGLTFHAQPTTLAIGMAATIVVSAITMFIVLRKLGSKPARELLAEGAMTSEITVSNGTRSAAWGIALGMIAAALLAFAFSRRESASPALFFTAGPLLLFAGLLLSRASLGAFASRVSSRHVTLGALGLRGLIRRHKRSLAIITLLACGTFMVVAVGANRRDATRDASTRASGTGGFTLIGQTSLTVVHNLNSATGREFYGLSDADLKDVSFVAFRVREGDDASCLNLTRAQQPRLLGVDPEQLARRGSFTFVKTTTKITNGWQILQQAGEATCAVGDENSIRWALGLSVGDELQFTGSGGGPFKVRIDGAVANSILQGSLVISEKEFLRRFPDESGYRMFLIDVPSNRVAEVSAKLTRAMQDVGVELIPAAQRLNEFNSVQNTYLNTFQMLGGLGLLLGSIGLGIVVLRNVFERRGELAVLQAVGLRRRRISWYVLSEHIGLLALGLVVGLIAACAAVLPVLLAPGRETHYRALAILVATTVASGLLWTWLATRFALRGNLLKALRNE